MALLFFCDNTMLTEVVVKIDENQPNTSRRQMIFDEGPPQVTEVTRTNEIV